VTSFDKLVYGVLSFTEQSPDKGVVDMSGSLATLKLYISYEASIEGKKPLFDLVL
jgi:hypothetical protein